MKDEFTKEELEQFAKVMEEIASMPREPYIRQPGEKGAYEVYNRKIENDKGL